MKWFRRLMLRVMMRAAKYAGMPLRDPALVAMFGREPTASGAEVDEITAMNTSAVWQATNLISSSVASLPIMVNDISDDNPHHVGWSEPGQRLLGVEPNPEMTPFIFKETLQAHALTWGNGYAQIEWADPGAKTIPLALWPLLPNQCRPQRRLTGELFYEFHAHEPGEVDAELAPEDVLHIPGLGFDGTVGYPVIQLARESIGLNLATEQFGASFFGRGATPGGIIEHPAELSEPARKNLRESWESLHRGVTNAHRIAILEEGAKFTTTGESPEQSQFLQTRQFQIVEVARWFNIPPHMLRDLSAATFSNIEHQQLEFLMYTLLPWLIRWTQEIQRKLYRRGPWMSRRVDAMFDATKLLKADITTRFAAYSTARNGGWYTINDILRSEGLKQVDPAIGDKLIAPSTMKVLGDVDPSTPIDIDAFTKAVDWIKANSISPETARQVLNAVVPGAADTMVAAVISDISKGPSNGATQSKSGAGSPGGGTPGSSPSS